MTPGRSPRPNCSRKSHRRPHWFQVRRWGDSWWCLKSAKAEGRNDDRIELAQRATAVAAKAFGQYSVESAQAWSLLGNSFWAVGRREDSLHASEESMKILEVAVGKEDPKMVWRYQDVADGYGALGRDDETVPLLERAYGLALRVLDPDSTDLADVAVSLAYELTRKNPQRALGLLNESVARYETKQAPDALTYILRVRSRVLSELQRGTEALADCDRVERIYHRADVRVPDEDFWVIRCRGDAFLALHRYNDAEVALKNARDFPTKTKIPPGVRARLLFELARAQKGLNVPVQQVRKLCEEGLQLVARFPPVSEVKRELLSCLAELPAPSTAAKTRATP